MFPAFAHFRRTATRDTELHGQEIKEGEKVVMWYVSSGRDETRYRGPDRFDVTRNPEHQAFGAGGRHFCLGTALARLELQILIEETLARYPEHQPRRRAGVRRIDFRQPAANAAREADRLTSPGLRRVRYGPTCRGQESDDTGGVGARRGRGRDRHGPARDDRHAGPPPGQAPDRDTLPEGGRRARRRGLQLPARGRCRHGDRRRLRDVLVGARLRRHADGARPSRRCGRCPGRRAP